MRKITILEKDTLNKNITYEYVGNIFNTNFDFQCIPESINLAGVSFEDRQLIIPMLQLNDAITLVRDPHNEYDKYAIKVINNANHIGWIPKEIAFYLSQEIDAGIKWKGIIKEITGNEDTLRGIVVKLFYLNE